MLLSFSRSLLIFLFRYFKIQVPIPNTRSQYHSIHSSTIREVVSVVVVYSLWFLIDITIMRSLLWVVAHPHFLTMIDFTQYSIRIPYLQQILYAPKTQKQVIYNLQSTTIFLKQKFLRKKIVEKISMKRYYEILQHTKNFSRNKKEGDQNVRKWGVVHNLDSSTFCNSLHELLFAIFHCVSITSCMYSHNKYEKEYMRYTLKTKWLCIFMVLLQ